MRTIVRLVLVVLAAIAALISVGSAAHAQPGFEQITSDDGQCRVQTREQHHHAVKEHWRASGWSPIAQLYHPGWSSRHVVGGRPGGQPHVMNPGTQLRFVTRYASIQPAWLVPGNGARGIEEVAPQGWPMPGAPKFALIGAYLDPRTMQPFDIDTGGARNGVFLIGKDRGCRPGPDVPFVVGVRTNDDYDADGYRIWAIDVEERPGKAVAVTGTDVDRPQVPGECDNGMTELRFSATISGTAGQLVRYRWMRSDTQHTEFREARLPRSGRLTVSDTWTRGPGRGWATLDVHVPARVTGKPAWFDVAC